ncbi:MAG: hypothetical protein Kilf2KO_44650 [Rhodospirillales bacterium]
MTLNVAKMRADGVSQSTIDRLLTQAQAPVMARPAHRTSPPVTRPLAPPRARLVFRVRLCRTIAPAIGGCAPGNETAVLAAAARAAKLSQGELIGEGRARKFTAWRAAVTRLLREEGWSFPRIGRFLGGRDHTSVMYYEKAWFQREETQAAYGALLKELAR